MERKQETTGIKLFTLNSNRELAAKIADYMNVELCDASIKHFSDGEIQIKVNESIRGDDVYVIQSIADPINENFMELMVMIDALRRSSAGTINVVIPYYGYARADRKTRSREPITAKLIANLIEMAGVDRVIAMDLHAAQLQGFFNIPVDHIFAIFEQAKYFKEKGLDHDVVVVAPDHSSVKGARNLAELLKAPIAIIDERHVDGKTYNAVIGDVKGYRCIVVDDMIDTGHRMMTAATTLKEAGATDIYACATHAILSGTSVEDLKKSDFCEVVVTDTISLPEEKKFDKLTTISVAEVLGEAISLIYNNHSVNELFDKSSDI
ncbi:ribose-phosphate diphosphokinase [Ligilactobacillus ceti]|nr:ribose-phosphate pyrophosphokinase [Ligilactobacillus ceti]